MTRRPVAHAALLRALAPVAALGLLASCTAPEPPGVPSQRPGVKGADVSTSSQPPQPSTSQSDDPAPPLAVRWSLDDVIPATDVRNVAGRAVLVVSKGGAFELQVLDLRTGGVQWAHRVGTSLVPTSAPMSVTALANRHVAVLEPLPGKDGRARMRLLDVEQDGTAVASTGIHQFISFPRPCDDDSGWVCASALKGSGVVQFRLSATGGAVQRTVPQVGDSYTEIGPRGMVRFLDAGSRRPTIGMLSEGKLLWKKPERELFGSMVPEEGWVVRQQGTVVYGTVTLPRAQVTDPMPRRMASFGLDGRTGRLLWRTTGADLGCSARRDVELVCQWQAGTMRRDGRVIDGRMVVSRIDLRTGQPLWSTRPFFVQGQGVAQLGTSGDGVVVTEPESRTHIDAVTGTTRPATASDITWHQVHTRVPEPVVEPRGDRPGVSRRARLNRPVPVSDPLRIHGPLPPGVGAQFGRTQVFAMPGRVVAVQLP
ncbi:hypothetical protein GCM10027030_09700 [Luteococcus sediminum]